MLTRYWQWTSAGADSGVPFGPLRYRQWTSAPSGTAVTSLPFGPLRYRAWTNGVEPEPPQPEPTPGGRRGEPFLRLDLAKYELIERDDTEIVAFLASLLASGALH